MLDQQARSRLRQRAGRGSCLAAICFLSPIWLWFSAHCTAFAQPPSASAEVTAARRQFLAAAGAGLLAVAAGPEAAHADLFEQTQFSGGVRNNPTTARPESNVAEELKKMGSNLGRVVNLRGTCAEAQPEGFVARLSPGRVIVWDADAACGEGKSFIHAAGRQNGFAPMSAADGPTRHLVKAAAFDNDEIMETYKGQIGKCYETPKGGVDEISWEIASASRGGKC